jgi:predicted methyltransferase
MALPDTPARGQKMAATRLNNRVRPNIGAIGVACVLATVAVFAAPICSATDIYDAAVQHQGRTPDDQKRDALDHPAQILRLAGIEPGMQVGDFMASDGYYSELLSYIVGPKGHVLLINNPSFDRWANNAWTGRIAHNRLPNVEHQTVDLNHMSIADGSLDALLVVKVYHDMYWVDTEDNNWPKVDTAAVLDKLVKTLKPHGILVIVDHSSKPGAGNTEAGSLHRIEESYARHDFESRGMKLVAKSDILRMPSDPRTQVSYKEPILGKTDRFVLVFRKLGG